MTGTNTARVTETIDCGLLGRVVTIARPNGAQFMRQRPTAAAVELFNGQREWIMTEQDAIDMLRQCQSGGDIEADHSNADNVLCQFLIELGYPAVVDEWRKVEKWYA